MKYLVNICFSFILTFSGVAALNAQDAMLLMNGKEVVGKLVTIDSVTVEFERDKKSKRKIIRYKKEKVFSITKADGSKVYIFQPDSFETEILSIEEMELFVYGIREARLGYKAPIALWEGIFCGVVSGFVGAVVGPFYAPIPIAGNSILVGNFPSKVNIESVLNPNYFKKETFLAGYKEEANFKRMKNVTIGSVIGFAIGYAAFSAL